MNHQDLLEAAAYIELYIRDKLDICLFLHPDCAQFLEQVENKIIIPYEKIPHFPIPKDVKDANVVLGTIHGKGVLILQSYFQLYKGNVLEELAFLMHVVKLLAIKQVLLVDYCEAVHPDYQVEDFIITSDHINGMTIVPSFPEWESIYGSARINLDEPYANHLQKVAKRIADKLMIRNHVSVRYGYLGPSYPTNAEANMYRMLGADVVSMSNLYEAIIANYLHMEVLSLSCVVRKAKDGKDQEAMNQVQRACASRFYAWIQNILLEL